LFFDQLPKLSVFGRVIRIDPEQELLIVRVEEGLAAQSGRMWPGIQVVPEFIDVGLIELPELLTVER